MKVGFTGTQSGLTPLQRQSVRCVLEEFQVVDFHHGDCVGADTQAHEEALSLSALIHLHPPKNPNKRSFCKADVSYPEKDYLVRNHDIVDMTDVLIVAPKGYEEEIRSGTWATYRYAKKKNKRIIVVFPNGDSVEE